MSLFVLKSNGVNQVLIQKKISLTLASLWIADKIMTLEKGPTQSVQDSDNPIYILQMALERNELMSEFGMYLWNEQFHQRN